MHRSTAKAYTKRAQIAGAVLVLAAGAVVAIPSKPPELAKLEVPPPVVNNDAAEKAAKRIEVAGASPAKANILDSVAPPVPVVKVEKKEGPPAPPPPPPPPPLKYIGAIMTGSFKRAIVVQTDSAQKETQKMLAEGDKLEKQDVIEIAAEFIRLRDDKGKEEKIDLAPRQTRALRIVNAAGQAQPAGAPGAFNPNAAAFNPNAPAMNNPAVAAEVQALENKVSEMEKNGDGESAAKLRNEIDRMRGVKGGGKGGKDGGEGVKGGK